MKLYNIISTNPLTVNYIIYDIHSQHIFMFGIAPQLETSLYQLLKSLTITHIHIFPFIPSLSYSTRAIYILSSLFPCTVYIHSEYQLWAQIHMPQHIHTVFTYNAEKLTIANHPIICYLIPQNQNYLCYFHIYEYLFIGSLLFYNHYIPTSFNTNNTSAEENIFYLLITKQPIMYTFPAHTMILNNQGFTSTIQVEQELHQKTQS